MPSGFPDSPGKAKAIPYSDRRFGPGEAFRHPLQRLRANGGVCLIARLPDCTLNKDMMEQHRIGTFSRETKETSIECSWDLDGTGRADVSTGIGMLDHLVSQVARHGIFDITLK